MTSDDHLSCPSGLFLGVTSGGGVCTHLSIGLRNHVSPAQLTSVGSVPWAARGACVSVGATVMLARVSLMVAEGATQI